MNTAVKDLLSRLEQVSGRLSKVEAQLAGGAAPASGGSATASPAASAGGDGVHPKVAGYDALINEHIKALEAAAEAVGTDSVKETVSTFAAAVAEQRKLIDIASRSKSPGDVTDPTFQALIKECGALMQKAGGLKQKSHKSEPDFNHISALADGIQALQWVCFKKGGAMDRVPGPVVKEFADPAAFFLNRILREHKGEDNHVKFVNAVKGFFADLEKYVKSEHTQGLWWNPNGGDAKANAASAGGASSSSSSTASSSAADAKKVAAPKKTAGAKGLFAELNKGGAVTTGLKKVTKDMQTHKNPNLRAGGTVKSTPKKTAPARKWGGAASSKKYDPVFELQGNKWVVEHHTNNKEIIISDTEVKHTVYLYRLEGCVVKVDGAKVNAITFDSCKRTGVVFNNVVSGVEVINCSRVDVQTTGAVPNFAIDKSSGVQVYLSKDAVNAQIVTSKSDSVNVLVPTEDGQDIKEFPVPEQFLTVYKDGALHTTTVQHE
eukprot:CAMPEP_0201545600 /NCGR_PEP_ID=MMETSP0173_2-20130828/2057_1 /ASSEMBLY_ACC=CAM_ASM_000268 /TAXON_ID=218659 /ORGANISM="Vexillifera sp., Strain DIVA3 564/2" /LENGTH=490 /DNA_ID=CAMNT_0047954035 /DNA_START=16 /DNA_END=1488 /DNA_ORIENTATION=+